MMAFWVRCLVQPVSNKRAWSVYISVGQNSIVNRKYKLLGWDWFDLWIYSCRILIECCLFQLWPELAALSGCLDQDDPSEKLHHYKGSNGKTSHCPSSGENSLGTDGSTMDSDHWIFDVAKKLGYVTFFGEVRIVVCENLMLSLFDVSHLAHFAHPGILLRGFSICGSITICFYIGCRLDARPTILPSC